MHSRVHLHQNTCKKTEPLQLWLLNGDAPAVNDEIAAKDQNEDRYGEGGIFGMGLVHAPSLSVGGFDVPNKARSLLGYDEITGTRCALSTEGRPHNSGAWKCRKHSCTAHPQRQLKT